MRIIDWSSDVCSSDLVAALSVGWWVALPCLLGVPPLVIGLRWYLARAKDGYLRENASYSQISETLTESTEGARTIKAIGMRNERVRSDVRREGKACVSTCRTRWSPEHIKKTRLT